MDPWFYSIPGERGEVMEFESKHPIYLQIADWILENILEEKWKEEDKIPSVRELAVSIEVNPNTVMRTYSHLQDMGIIYNQRGIGYFVTAGGCSLVKDLKKKEFVSDELPRTFRTMKLLDMTIGDIEEIYEDYRRNVQN